MILKPPKGKLLNRNQWMSRGLVGCWLFNLHPQVLGQAFDYVNGHHGTLVNDTHSVPGKFGNVLDFDGTGDYVGCGNILGFGDVDYTITCWVKLNNKGAVQVFVGKGRNSLGGASNSIEYTVGYSLNDDRLRFVISDQTSVQNILADSLGSPSVGVWYYVVGIHSAANNEIQIYINGQLDNSAGTTVTPSVSTGTFNIGAWDPGAGNQKYINGQIDHVLIYDRALTAYEVLSSYREPFQMFEGSGL